MKSLHQIIAEFEKSSEIICRFYIEIDDYELLMEYAEFYEIETNAMNDVMYIGVELKKLK